MKKNISKKKAQPVKKAKSNNLTKKSSSSKKASSVKGKSNNKKAKPVTNRNLNVEDASISRQYRAFCTTENIWISPNWRNDYATATADAQSHANMGHITTIQVQISE
jgi:hypothetical protein